MTEKFLIGTYTNNDSKGIYQIELDTKQQKLENSQLIAKAESPTYLAESDAKIIYAIDKDLDHPVKKGGLLVLNGKQTQATEVQKLMENGASPAYVTVDEKRQNVYTANYHTGDVIIYSIGKDGKLTITDRIHDEGEGGPRPEQQDGAHPHYADLTFDNRLVICDLGLDRVYLYDISDHGKASLVSELTMEPGFGPRHIKFVEATGKAYLVGELSSQIAVLNYDEETGVFSVQQILKTIPSDWKEHNGCAAIHISADNKFVYVSNRGHDSIAVFEILSDGNLKNIQYISTEGEFPRDFNFSKDQNFLIAANQNTNNVSLYTRNADTGLLKLVQKDFRVPEGTCVILRK